MWKIPERTEEQLARVRLLNRNKKGDYPCVICGIICSKPKVMVRLGEGGSHLVTDEEASRDEAADLGYHPIGPECWKKYRKEIESNASIERDF